MHTVPLGIVFKDDKVLLVHRRFYPKLWGPPGGFINEGEKIEDALEREVFEESGIVCNSVKQIHEFDAYDTHLIVYACTYVSGSIRCSYESKDAGWFSIDDLPSPISPNYSIFKLALDTIKRLK